MRRPRPAAHLAARWPRPRDAAALAIVVAVLAGCSDPRDDRPAPVETTTTTIAVDTIEIPQTQLQGDALIIDRDDEVVACFEAGDEANPPDCSGVEVPVTGWTWGGLPDIQEQGSTRWATYPVVATLDPLGPSMTVTGVSAATASDEEADADEEPPTTAPVGTETGAEALEDAREAFDAAAEEGIYDDLIVIGPAQVDDDALVIDVVWAPTDTEAELARTYRVPVVLRRSLANLVG